MRTVEVGDTAIGIWAVLIPKDGTAIVHCPRVNHARNPGATAQARGVVDGFGKRVGTESLAALKNPPRQADRNESLGGSAGEPFNADSVNENTLKGATQNAVSGRILLIPPSV